MDALSVGMENVELSLHVPELGEFSFSHVFTCRQDRLVLDCRHCRTETQRGDGLAEICSCGAAAENEQSL